MNPVLYRYRDSESVIKAMEGYTPAEGWEPLYDQSAIDAAVAAERKRCAKVCIEWADAHANATGTCTYENCDFVAAAMDCADAIRKGGE